MGAKYYIDEVTGRRVPLEEPAPARPETPPGKIKTSDRSEVLPRIIKHELVAPIQPVPYTLNALQTFCAADLDGLTVPKRQWLVKDVIPFRNVANLSGDGGIGKSILGLMLGTSLSTRTPWLGFETMQGPFLYLGAEDDRDELHIRLDLIRQKLDLSWGDLADFHFRSLVGEDAVVSVFDRNGQAMIGTPLLNKIENRIRDLGAICTVLDTSADVFGGDEINRSQVRQFIGLLRGVCLRTNSTIQLFSHPSLSGMASGSGTSGSTGWNNSVRARAYLEADPDDPDARILNFKKLNYGPKGKPMRLICRNGLFVPDDGKAAECKQVNAEAMFLVTLTAYAGQKRDVSPNLGANYAPTVFARDPACKGFKMDILRDAMNALFTKGEIKVEKVGPPSRQVSIIVRKISVA